MGAQRDPAAAALLSTRKNCSRANAKSRALGQPQLHLVGRGEAKGFIHRSAHRRTAQTDDDASALLGPLHRARGQRARDTVAAPSRNHIDVRDDRRLPSIDKVAVVGRFVDRRQPDHQAIDFGYEQRACAIGDQSSEELDVAIAPTPVLDVEVASVQFEGHLAPPPTRAGDLVRPDLADRERGIGAHVRAPETARLSSSRPAPGLAGTRTPPPLGVAVAMSLLFHATIAGFSPAPSSRSTVSTASRWRIQCALLESITCTKSVALVTSSSVARNAATSSFGRSLTKPTVSATMALASSSSRILRSVGSSVAKG